MHPSRQRTARTRRAAFLIVAAAVAGCGPASRPAGVGTPAPAVPARPPLAAHYVGDADSGAVLNQPELYMAYGLTRLGREPDSAAAAFYWASRLDPWRADALYARGLAILLAHIPDRAPSYLQRRRVVGKLTPSVVQQVDSLMRLAMAHDPFLVRQWDYLLTGRPPAAVRARMKDPADAGYWAFDAGEYAEAVALLGRAMAKYPTRVALRGLRAQSFYHLRQYDSAATELTRMLDTLVTRDTSGGSRFYQSKEIIYYALGFVRVQQGDTARARVAFGSALTENLGFYMAHVRLAGLALAEHDTAGALREMEQALVANASDPGLRFHQARLLGAVRRRSEALDELRQAVQLDPDFAASYELAASLYEAEGDTAAAVGSYRAFLAHSFPASPSYAPVVARLRALGAATTTSGSP